MNFNFESIEEIKREAIAFKKDYPVTVKRLGGQGQSFGWSPDEEFLKKWQHCYSVNNGTLAYVDGDTVYVIPVLSNVRDVIYYSNYDMETFQKMSSENNFYVPLSNGEVLEDYNLQNHWVFLRAVQREYFRRDNS